MTDAARRASIAAAWLVLGVALVLHAQRFGFVTDDAYISFRYAENLARHGALEFNLGERVEGYTNFLWTVLLAGGIRAGVAPEIASRVLGAVFGLASLALAWRLACRKIDAPAALLAPALLVTIPAFACWTSGGLETQMFTALALAGALAWLSDRDVAGGALYAAATMTRPEGALVFALAAAADLAATRRWRWRGYAAFAVPVGAFFAWRLRTYGYPFPNTFYIKTSTGGAALARGLAYLRSFVVDNRAWALAPFAAFFRARDRRLWLHAAAIVPTYVAYVAWVGGDFMGLHRFLVPLLPYVAIAFAEAAAELLPPHVSPDRSRVALWLRPRRARWLAPAGVALVALAAWNGVRVGGASLASTGAVGGVDSIGYLRKFADDRVKVGRWMRANLPPDTLVSVGGAGALPYASGLRALDAFGLNDLHIAHEVRAQSDRPGHQKVAPLAYLLQRHVDVVCFPPYEELARHGYRRRCYPVDVTPRYCCWERQR